MDPNYKAICSWAAQPENLQSTVDYIAKQLSGFLTPQDRVLVCFPSADSDGLGSLMKQAAQAMECPVFCVGEDLRWKTLLWLAFFHHATAIIGPPDTILGLRKLAKATATPLYIRNVILCGAPSEAWQRQSIHNGLDCHIWGCYAPGSGPVVAGFTCEYETGIHIREDVYRVTASSEGLGVPGELAISPHEHPDIVWLPGERAAVAVDRCQCGYHGAVLVEFENHDPDDKGLSSLSEQLLSWSSVLDYRAAMTPFGLDLEIVTFPGEKLPRLPSCAKLKIRNWNGEEDVPFSLIKR